MMKSGRVGAWTAMVDLRPCLGWFRALRASVDGTYSVLALPVATARPQSYAHPLQLWGNLARSHREITVPTHTAADPY